MAMQSGTVRWLKALKRWRLYIIHENGDHICIVQGILEVHPGRRREGQGHDKDWTKENTREIDWPKLKIFLRRHAKRLNGYIQETFWLYIHFPEVWNRKVTESGLVPAAVVIPPPIGVAEFEKLVVGFCRLFFNCSDVTVKLFLFFSKSSPITPIVCSGSTATPPWISSSCQQ